MIGYGGHLETEVLHFAKGTPMKITYKKVDNPWDVITTLRLETNKILFISERIFDFSQEVEEGNNSDLLFSNNTEDLLPRNPWSAPYTKTTSKFTYIVYDFTKTNIPPDFYTHMEFAQRLLRNDKEVIVLCQFTDNVPDTLPSALVPIDVGKLDYVLSPDLEYFTHLPKLLSEEARAAGVATPKGTLFIGVPGTGKTLTAQYIATLLNRPLYQLDLSNLYNRLVGESEKAAQAALNFVANTDCVFFIDELDKLFTPDTANAVQHRVLSILLTWLSTGNKKCYTILAANRAANIPIELLRKGRVDRVIHLKLPSTEHVARLLLAYGEDLPIKVEDVDGFTQAEIVWYCNKLRELQFLGLPLNMPYTPMSKKLPHIVEEIEKWSEIYAD